MNKKSIILFLLLTGVTASATAQIYTTVPTYTPLKKKYFGFAWNVSFPTGTTRDFTDKTSFSGFSIEGRSHTTPNVMLGGFFGWNYLYQVKTDPVTIDQPGVGGTVSGTQERFINSVPMLFTAAYDLGEGNDMVQPFVSLGIGATYYLQRWSIGVSSLEQRTWHFTLMPEAGAYISFDERGTTALFLTARYLLGFDASTDVLGRDDNQITYFMIGAGLMFSPF
jgi:hypothetical protein